MQWCLAAVPKYSRCTCIGARVYGGSHHVLVARPCWDRLLSTCMGIRVREDMEGLGHARRYNYAGIMAAVDPGHQHAATAFTC